MGSVNSEHSIIGPYQEATLHSQSLITSHLCSSCSSPCSPCPSSWPPPWPRTLTTDGWELNEGMNGEHCGCFLLAGSERVTREDADILCQFHDGAWVAEPSRPGLSYWLKARLLETTDIGEYAMFWLGAHATGKHSE